MTDHKTAWVVYLMPQDGDEEVCTIHDTRESAVKACVSLLDVSGGPKNDSLLNWEQGVWTTTDKIIFIRPHVLHGVQPKCTHKDVSQCEGGVCSSCSLCLAHAETQYPVSECCRHNVIFVRKLVSRAWTAATDVVRANAELERQKADMKQRKRNEQESQLIAELGITCAAVNGGYCDWVVVGSERKPCPLRDNKHACSRRRNHSK